MLLLLLLLPLLLRPLVLSLWLNFAVVPARWKGTEETDGLNVRANVEMMPPARRSDTVHDLGA